MIKTNYSKRKYVIISIYVLVGVIYLFRLFIIQVVDNDYKLYANKNVLRYETQYPARGLVFDRNGELLVYNEAAYDLMVTPRLVKEFDTVEFCTLLNINKEQLNKRFEKVKKYSYYKPSIFLEQISKEDYAFFGEKLYKYPGFYVQARTLRKYPMPIAAHILGYVGEVDQRDLKKDDYYKQGDYVGKSGIELTYEKILRGDKGLKVKMVDVFNRDKGSYQEGKYDTSAISGEDIYLSIDYRLQIYGEKLMQNKRGSIVAIEPSSGDILALISSPAYDPNLLIGRIRTENFNKLSTDSLEPLFNRAIMAQYPPGSTFKTINALIGLQEDVLKPETKYSCQGVISTPIVCSHNHKSPLNLIHAIEQSCNPYFWKVFKSITEKAEFDTYQEGYNIWRNHVASFGIGSKIKNDLVNQRPGNLPKETYFNKYYGKKGWRAITVRSLAIGQGEIELTPLQLANVTATIANRGYYKIPHIIKSIKNIEYTSNFYQKKIITTIDSSNFETVIEGMNLVYEGEHGTARWYKIDSIKMCGKTGTAENPFGENHSVFIAFAPMDNPQIAISVVVENAGFGSTWAAPIASLIIAKYLNSEIKNNWFEKKILDANLLEIKQKKPEN
ncbi:MAG: penicillin-binding protein 2 [Bacteroidales bacterium]|nr:penicillin-binding protein 2 [Bacteroidales bacterium]